eukprot:4600786-Ditylum_brightwellii.AAC.1
MGPKQFYDEEDNRADCKPMGAPARQNDQQHQKYIPKEDIWNSVPYLPHLSAPTNSTRPM